MQKVDDKVALFVQKTSNVMQNFSYMHYIHDDIKNNAWVTVNNDFWVMSEAICR